MVIYSINLRERVFLLLKMAVQNKIDEKAFLYAERCEEKCEDFLKKIKSILSESFVFIDEPRSAKLNWD